ncbi:MAG: hypothetical protein ACOX4D_04415 [Bacteroidales bacterium]|jgi:hypothetical protein
MSKKLIHLKNDLIDKEKWDRNLEKSYFKRTCLYSWYLDIVCPKWEILTTDDNYSNAFILPLKNKLGVNYLIQPFLIQQLGSIGENHNAIFLHTCLKYIKRKYPFYFINLNEIDTLHISSQSSKLNKTIKHKKLKSNLILDTKKTYKELYDAYSKNTKRNIKKFHKNDSNKIKIATSKTDIEKIIELNKNTIEEHQFSDNQTKLLKKIIFECQNRNLLESIAAYHNDVLTAGAFFVKCNNYYTFLYSGNTEIGMQTGAMHSIVDYFLKGNNGNFEFLDFEGSENKGVARFYKSFNAIEHKYLIFKRLIPGS